MDVKIASVNEELGLVFGFAIICLKNGEPYYDLQDEHIPEQVMLKASCDFMINSRVAKEMHRGEGIGNVIFAFPMTNEIAKAMGISTFNTGLMIAMRPNASILKKFKSGELTGFSVGGEKVRTTVNE